MLTATRAPGSGFVGWTVGGGGCTGAVTPCFLNVSLFSFFSLTARFEPAPDAPVVQTGAASGVLSHGVTVAGTINPNSAIFATQCKVEYGLTADYGQSAPCSTASVPAGTSNVAVTSNLGYLEPGSTYHYRIIGINAGGTSHGDDATFTTAERAEDDCGNAELRSQQGPGAALLPACMAYEWISAVDSNGTGLRGGFKIAPDGSRALFTAQSAGDPESEPAPNNDYIATRTPEGWQVVAPTPPADIASGNGDITQTGTPSADLSRVLWQEASVADRQRGKVSWAIYGTDGSRTVAHPAMTPLNFVVQQPHNPNFGYYVAGATPDLSRFTFFRSPQAGAATGTFFPDEGLTTESNLYSVAGAGTTEARFEIVNRQSDIAPGVPGPVLGGTCGAKFGEMTVGFTGRASYRAISVDGSSVYFSTPLTAPPAGSSLGCSSGANTIRVFKRIDSSTTVQVSQSQCTRVTPACAGTGLDAYAGASEDGSVAVFTSSRQLTNSDLDTTNDLYVYDSDPPAGQPTLVQASAGETVGGHTTGSGASVMGFIDVSADGSRTYFAASGVLTGPNARGVSPVAGQRNLYVFERDAEHPAGRIAFIATDNGNTVGDAGEGVGDGRFLLFTGLAQLVAGDTDASFDAYRYDDVTGALDCLSCVGDGGFAVTIAEAGVSLGTFSRLRRPASGDMSRIAFATAERLVEEDRNDVVDAYLWDDGSLSLISGGTGFVGIVGVPDVAADGQSVFFTTKAGLVGSDRNRQLDLYAARVDGGFAEPSPPVACAVLDDGCQGGGSGSLLSDARTSSPPGGKNAAAEARKTLALGSVSRNARRRASRSGLLSLSVRTSSTGTVSLTAKARLDKRTKRVGRASKEVGRAGVARVVLRLSRSARRYLRSGRGLRLTVEVRQVGARSRSIGVLLPGVES